MVVVTKDDGRILKDNTQYNKPICKYHNLDKLFFFFVHFSLILGVNSFDYRNEIEEAAIIISGVSAFYNLNVLKKPLTTAFYNKRDVNSFITIARHVYENYDRRDIVLNELEETRTEVADKEDVVGDLILDLASRRQFGQVAYDLLQALVEQGNILCAFSVLGILH